MQENYFFQIFVHFGLFDEGVASGKPFIRSREQKPSVLVPDLPFSL